MSYFIPKDVPGPISNDVTESRVTRLYRELGGWRQLVYRWHFGGVLNRDTHISVDHQEFLNCPTWTNDECRCMLHE